MKRMYTYPMLARHFLPHILRCPHQRDQFACFQDWLHICIHNNLKISPKKRIRSIQVIIQWCKRFKNKRNDVTWANEIQMNVIQKYDCLTIINNTQTNITKPRITSILHRTRSAHVSFSSILPYLTPSSPFYLSFACYILPLSTPFCLLPLSNPFGSFNMIKSVFRTSAFITSSLHKA